MNLMFHVLKKIKKNETHFQVLTQRIFILNLFVKIIVGKNYFTVSCLNPASVIMGLDCVVESRSKAPFQNAS